MTPDLQRTSCAKPKLSSRTKRGTFALQHRLHRDRAQRRFGDLVDLDQHALQRGADLRFLAWFLRAVAGGRFEQRDDIHQGRTAAIADEAIAARGAATAAHQARVGERAQHLREMVARHAEALGEIGGRKRALGIARQLEHGVKAKPGRGLQLHAALRSSRRKSASPGPRDSSSLMRRGEPEARGPEEAGRVTPSSLKRATSASNKALPTPRRRTLGSIWIAKTQPAGGWPNSQARTSPAMKPAKAPFSVSATRKCRPGPSRSRQ